MWTLRLSLLIGGALIALFMIGDVQLVPEGIRSLYLQNRAVFQLPLIALVFFLTYHSRFPQFAQPLFFVGVVGLTYINYAFIGLAWTREGFSFPYEGTLLYAFFGYFALGMTFRYALATMIVSTAGFLLLMLIYPVYGQYTYMNVGFVAGSLFIGVFARYRLDSILIQLGRTNEKLKGLSNQDSLTGLLNRRAFQAESERIFDLTRRSEQSLAVFMMDLDYFKQFNDRLGHQAGDEAIQWHADLMRIVFQRKADTLARYGGEEFVAIVFSQTTADASRQAQQIVTAWQDKSQLLGDPSSNSKVGCSIGVCHGSARQFNSVDDMIRIADAALYQAKEQGRGRFVIAGQDEPSAG